MAHIEKRTDPVYLAPTAGRRYFTQRGAAYGEASAMMRNKWPDEYADYDDCGRMTYPGWTWREDDELVKVHARVMRMILRRLRVA